MKPIADLPSTTEIRQFQAVAEVQSFSEAARRFGLSTAAVSATIARLEQLLSVRLFERTTRKVRLTHEGEVFLKHCQEALFHIEAGVQETRQAQTGLSGIVRISAPSDLAHGQLSIWLQSFISAHPNVQVQLNVADRVTDLVSENIDIAIRYGEPQDSSLIARRLCDVHRLLCASPSFIEAFGAPKHPDELTEYPALCYEVAGQINDLWTFRKDDQDFSVRVNSIFRTDDSSLTREWGLQGKGLVYKGEIDLRADIQQGRLIPLLTDYETRYTPLYLMYPSAKHLPARTNHLIRHLLDMTQSERTS